MTAAPPASTTEGTLLGGRVRFRQPQHGYRTSLEPVLLAAAIPAQPGQRVLEAGTGAGAALLCLAARCPGVTGAGIERDALLASLARANLRCNAALSVVQADLAALPPGPPLDQPFDHAFANPPWHGASSTASRNPMRDGAKRATPGTLHGWAVALAARLRPRGSLTLIVPAAAAAAGLAALDAARCGSPALLPLWPRAGAAAKIVLLQGVLGGRGGCRVLPGLTLHAGPAFTPAARAILWDAAALPL